MYIYMEMHVHLEISNGVCLLVTGIFLSYRFLSVRSLAFWLCKQASIHYLTKSNAGLSREQYTESEL